MNYRLVWILLFALMIGNGAAPAFCVPRDQKAIATSGLYGIGGGMLAGLLLFPVARTSRTIFIGGSVGLYLGIAVGVYHIYHRDDPGNPLSTRSASLPSQGEVPGAMQIGQRNPAEPEVEISLPVLRF